MTLYLSLWQWVVIGLAIFVAGAFLGALLGRERKDVLRETADYKARKEVADYYSRNQSLLANTTEQQRDWLIKQHSLIHYYELKSANKKPGFFRRLFS